MDSGVAQWRPQVPWAFLGSFPGAAANAFFASSEFLGRAEGFEPRRTAKERRPRRYGRGWWSVPGGLTTW